MSMQIVRRIAEERENSQIVPSKPRTELQRVRLVGLYELLILLRIILTLNIQTGWIHQDEMSNSIEVVAGDYFNLQVFKPPQFNSTFPTSSVTLLHTTIYFPYLLTSYFLSYDHPVGKEPTPNTKLLILIPRIVQLLLSFLVDYILVKFSILNAPNRRRLKAEEIIASLAKEPKPDDNANAKDSGKTNGSNPKNDELNPYEKLKKGHHFLSKIPEEGTGRKEDQENQASASTSSTSRKRPQSSRSSTQSQQRNAGMQLQHQSQNQGRSSGPENPPEDPSQAEEKPPQNTYTIRLVTLASSQVILVLAQRTHPSSLNLLLFSCLLYLVSASFHAYEDYIPLLEAYQKTPLNEPVTRALLLKRIKRQRFSYANRIHWIALLTVIGLFNDPEFFISYAALPLFFYMQRGISHRLVGMKAFHARIFLFLALFFLFSIPFILYDSWWFGKLKWEDVRDLNLGPESFVVTPVNYFARKEGQFRDAWGYVKILGWYLILFNVLGVMGFVSFCKESYDMLFAEWKNKPNLDSHWTFLNCCLFLPLFFLIQAHGNSYSIFDLSPLLFPLVYMHGHKIPLASRFSSKVGLAWFGCNLLGVFYFGYAAQGGILTSFLDLYDNLTPIRFNNTQVDITLSQISAIPPTFTLAIPMKWKTIVQTGVTHDNENPPDLPDSLEDLSDVTINFNSNFNLNDPYETEGLPPSLHKTVLRLEQSSKVRVYHTGVSPLPSSHLERDLYRLLDRQDRDNDADPDAASKGQDKVSFLLIPYWHGRDCEERCRLVKITHVKTYWNHILVNWVPEGGLEFKDFSSFWKGLRRHWSSKTMWQVGLSLYRMEKQKGPFGEQEEGDSNRTKNKKKEEQKFYKLFQFHDAFYDFLKYIGNLVTITLTFGLFLTSYLVYLT